MKPVKILTENGLSVYSFDDRTFAVKIITPALEILNEEDVPPSTFIHFGVRVFSHNQEIDSRDYTYYPVEIRACEINVDLAGPFLLQGMHQGETAVYYVDQPRSYKGDSVRFVITSRIEFKPEDTGTGFEALETVLDEAAIQHFLHIPSHRLQEMSLSKAEAAAAVEAVRRMDGSLQAKIRRLNLLDHIEYINCALFAKQQIQLLKARFLLQLGKNDEVAQCVELLTRQGAEKCSEVADFCSEQLLGAVGQLLSPECKQAIQAVSGLVECDYRQ